ncbi:hypothetical protein J7E50_10800 [Pedobacter sp. ISL-68]|uniref:hypothetical protein n=1 Tax=unclassified Pedobacter TaxID=2628915 RepID=UPI001BE7D496|nr:MULTISPECIES: hypothetical protein [unclassified Pedobacter]MBT2561320.1 hypothetical protein [Pedobacter sp. ISL-64]MBT2590709.1 hypothetical protein [Pedobacter sp. ISL-68]
MSKQPFTDEGVRIKKQELYQLPDDALRAETESLRVDFRTWMHWHFDLDEKQRIFLESMEYPFIQVLAEDLSDCIGFRLPLSFLWPLHTIGSKFVQPISTLVRHIDPIKGYTVTGELTIEIGYR